MANGLLAKATLSAAIYTQVGQVPAGQTGAVNIRVVNLDPNNQTTIRLAVCPSTWVSGAPAAEDYIEPLDLVLPAGGVLEETALAVSSMEQVVAQSASGLVTVRTFGYLK